MARHLHLLPGRQPRIGVGHQRAGAALQPLHFAIDVHVGIFLGELSQLDDLAFQLGDGTFEFQVMHGSNHLEAAENDTGTRRKGMPKDPMSFQ